MGVADLPLAGTRVLAVEQYGAGPFATMHLADLGAQVIKIEAPARAGVPAGDSARYSWPFRIGETDSLFYQSFNRGKQSLSLNINCSEGRDVLRRLAASADIIVNNLRGDQPARLGLTYDALKDVNEKLICGHLSGYGREGERASWPAYDYLLQAEAGYFALTGEPDAPPGRMGLSVVDFLSGVTLAFAVTAALVGALRSGRGRDVDVTLYDVAMHQLTYPATWYLNEGYVTPRRPRSGHPSIVPCELFPTQDGWVMVMCVTERFWLNLCEAMELPGLPGDARFADNAARLTNRAALVETLDAGFRSRTSADWMARLGGKVPIAPILTLSEALGNPFLRERGGIATLSHGMRGSVDVVASPVRIDGDRLPAAPVRPLGADSDEVLTGVGLSRDEIVRLRAAGVV